MASTVDVAPSLGLSVLHAQGGGSYSAIDDRRAFHAGRSEGILSEGSYLVSQHSPSAAMSVDVAADTGDGLLVQGDSVAAQGLYRVPPAAGVITVDIAANSSGNPRNDLVVAEIKDNAHDGSGLSVSRVRVITGTANASATKSDSFGTNGTPSLPVSCLPLAVVNVANGAATIPTASIDDRRYRTAGKLSIVTTETFAAASYTVATTPDAIPNLVVSAKSVLRVGVRLHAKEATGAGTARIALNGTALAAMVGGGLAGAASGIGSSYGLLSSIGADPGLAFTASTPTDAATPQIAAAGEVAVILPAGVYTVAVQFQGTSISVKNRTLWAAAQAFPA